MAATSRDTSTPPTAKASTRPDCGSERLLTADFADLGARHRVAVVAVVRPTARRILLASRGALAGGGAAAGAQLAGAAIATAAAAAGAAAAVFVVATGCQRSERQTEGRRTHHELPCLVHVACHSRAVARPQTQRGTRFQERRAELREHAGHIWPDFGSAAMWSFFEAFLEWARSTRTSLAGSAEIRQAAGLWPTIDAVRSSLHTCPTRCAMVRLSWQI